MKLLDIKKYPNSILRKKSSNINKIDFNLQKLINNMAYTMYEFCGIGLAAPQVGINKRLIVYDSNLSINKKNTFMIIINPKIVYTNGETISEQEGCLSLPGLRTNLKRFKKIIVKGIDRYEKEISIKAHGILSIVLQHEIDHLNGTLLIDSLSALKNKYTKIEFENC